jgi:EmrB/QacA subfamily drug resistance transporter
MPVNKTKTDHRPDTAAPTDSGTIAAPSDPATNGSTAALVALGLAALLAVMDGTVVAVALKPLSVAFGSPLTTVVWATIAYLLAAATMLPLLGWASARFGGRAVFLTGLALFVLGSALCTVAWSAGALLAFRIVQGFGGGLLEPTSLMLAARLAGKNNVGRVLGTMSMIINVAPVFGPIVGGLLLETGHWQWVFVVNLPLGLGVLVAALTFVPADRPARGQDALKPPPADVRGLILLTAGYVAVLFALNRSGQPGVGWLVAVIAAAGVVLVAIYVRHALTTSVPPALDVRLLRRSGFAASLVVMAFVGLIMFSQLTALPIFDATSRNLHGVAAGLLVSALGLGLVVSMTAGGRISDRTGPRPLVRAGAIVTAAGLAIFALAHDHLPLLALFALFVVIGLGFGCTAAPTFASVFRTLPAAEQPQGTTALFMTVQFAASLGVTLLGLLQSRVPAHWLTLLFGITTVAALAIAVLARALPGRPAGQ